MTDTQAEQYGEREAVRMSDLYEALEVLRSGIIGVRDGTDDSGMSVDEQLDEMVALIDRTIGPEAE